MDEETKKGSMSQTQVVNSLLHLYMKPSLIPFDDIHADWKLKPFESYVNYQVRTLINLYFALLSKREKTDENPEG